MLITLIKFVSLLAVAVFSVVVIRRMFYCMTRCDQKSSDNTPVFFQMEDPYIAGLMEAMYKAGKLKKG